jgi:hypothetical protein
MPLQQCAWLWRWLPPCGLAAHSVGYTFGPQTCDERLMSGCLSACSPRLLVQQLRGFACVGRNLACKVVATRTCHAPGLGDCVTMPKSAPLLNDTSGTCATVIASQASHGPCPLPNSQPLRPEGHGQQQPAQMRAPGHRSALRRLAPGPCQSRRRPGLRCACCRLTTCQLSTAAAPITCRFRCTLPATVAALLVFSAQGSC